MRYSGYSTFLIVAVTGTLALQCLSLVVLFRRRLSAGGLSRPAGDMLARLKTAWQPRRRLDVDMQQELFRRLVSARVEYYVTQGMLRSLPLLTHAGGFALALTLADVLRGAPRWWTPAVDASVLLSVLFGMFVGHFPREMSTRWRQVAFNSVGYVVIGIYAGGPSDAASFLYAKRVAFFMRLYIAFTFPHVFWNIIWTCIFGAFSSYWSLSHQFYASSPVPTPSSWVLDEISEVVIVVCFTLAISRSLWARARHEVQEMSLRSQTSGMQTLLDLMCDVVVQLDTELRIAEHVPRFAAMLGLPNFKSTKGMLLQEFMPLEEDRLSFEKCLTETMSESTTGTGALHVRLRDCMSGLINVEVFYVQFTGLDNTKHHFAGIREFVEQPVSALKGFTSPPKPPKERPSRSPAKAKKGTSPVAESAPLHRDSPAQGPPIVEVLCGDSATGSDVSSRSSGSVPSRSKVRHLAAPAAMVQTAELGMEITLVQAMMTWCVDVDDSKCCEFHAFVVHLQATCKRLQAYQCTAFSNISAVQCRCCGVLASKPPRSMKCSFCGNAVQMVAPRERHQGRAQVSL